VSGQKGKDCPSFNKEKRKRMAKTQSRRAPRRKVAQKQRDRRRLAIMFDSKQGVIPVIAADDDGEDKRSALL